MNKTKIVAKIKQNNSTTEVLKDLILKGIDVFSIDLSNNDSKFCLDIIDKVGKLNDDLKTHVAIMLETVGNKVHINRLLNGKVEIKTGDKIRIYMDNSIGDNTKFSVDYSHFIDDIKYDSVIRLSNGLVELQVLDKEEDSILCEVLKGGAIYSHDKLVVPDLKLSREFLTDIDKEIILFASKHNVDYIAVSGVTSLDDILEVNDLLISVENNHLGILTKVENDFALDELDDIINISDGIIISRDDLGMNIPIERIPGIQKNVINKCHMNGKISVVAANIISAKEIIKAEVSDIANAVLDGTDAVSIDISGEEYSYPVDLLDEIEKIIKSAEEDIDYMNFLDRAIRSESQDITGNIACSVAEIANRLKCKAIVAPTISGYTARKMSRFRPRCIIIAVSPNKETLRSLSIYFGVNPIMVDNLKSLDDIVKQAKKMVKDIVDIEDEDKIIITSGYPFKDVRHTNLIEIEEL